MQGSFLASRARIQQPLPTCHHIFLSRLEEITQGLVAQSQCPKLQVHITSMLSLGERF